MPVRVKPANTLTLSALANVRNPLIDDLPDDASDLGDDCKPKTKKNNNANNYNSNNNNNNEYRCHNRNCDHNEVSREQELLELYTEQEPEHKQKKQKESELKGEKQEEYESCKQLQECPEENARSMSFLENSGLECSFGREFMREESESNDNYCGNRNSNYASLNTSVDQKANKIAIDAVLAATQHFVHIMQMHDLNSFFAVRNSVAREENVKRQLSTKSANEIQTIVMAFVEILEDLRIERGKLALLTGIPALEDNVPEERLMSASLFSTMSTASLSRPPVHETHEVAMSRDKQGNMMINRYIILANLGQGAYGKVKLGEDIDTGKQVAIKIISKKHLKKKIGCSSNAGEASDALNREIAIMKKVRHKNCVSLYEVIDDPVSQRLYLIMDYIPNGPVVRVQHQRVLPIFLAEVEAERVVDGIKYNRELVRCLVHHDANAGKVALSSIEMDQRPSLFMCKPLKQRLCANYLRQLVSGLRYMHKRNVVHHDIKPDNILLGYDHHVYLTDFGVSEIMETESNDEDNVNGSSGGNKSITNSPQDALSKNAHDAPSDNMREFKAHNGPSVTTSTTNTASVGKCTTKTTSQRCDRGARLGGGTLLFTAPEFFSSSANALPASERVNNPSNNNNISKIENSHHQQQKNINAIKDDHKRDEEEDEQNEEKDQSNDEKINSPMIDPFATDV